MTDDFQHFSISFDGDDSIVVAHDPPPRPTLEAFHALADSVMSKLKIPGLPEPPKSKQRKIARFAYLPCNGMMELSARARVAGILARRGWQCLVGDYAPMALGAFGDMPPGVVMFNSARVADAKAIYKAQSHGHFVVLHASDDLLAGNKYARSLADLRVPQLLGEVSRMPMTSLNIDKFGHAATKMFYDIIGEMPTDQLRAAVHAMIDAEYDMDVIPGVPEEAGGADHLANQFHRLWVGSQYAMPWFDLMTAWQCRKTKADKESGLPTGTAWNDVLPDSVVEDYADCGVYMLSPNVWAVRSNAKAALAAQSDKKG